MPRGRLPIQSGAEYAAHDKWHCLRQIQVIATAHDFADSVNCKRKIFDACIYGKFFGECPDFDPMGECRLER